MEYGKFIDGGRAYVVTTPYTPNPYINKLINDEYHLEVTQRLEGGGIAMAPNYASMIMKDADNHFYVTYGGKPYILARGGGKTYACEHRLHQTCLYETFDGFETAIRVFLPVKGQNEMWSFTVKNTGTETVEMSTFAAFPFAQPSMSAEARYDEQGNFLYLTGHPYYTRYEEKEKAMEKAVVRYIAASRRPDSYECDRPRFFGCDYAECMPIAVQNGKCENGAFELDRVPPMGVMQHRFRLAPSESATVHFVIGKEKTLENVREKFYIFPDIEEECNKVQKLWEERCEAFTIETPHEDLNILTNYWLKRQLTFFARLNRGSTYCPIRNQLQDYLGYAILDPEEALRKTVLILKRQHHDGFIKQYYNTDGAPEARLCLLRHSDPYIWLILATIEVVEKTGDRSNYYLPVEYKDCPVGEPIIEHLLKAARYMATQRGERGLCLMLDGDWNDPVNGPGRGGRGESGWNSMAFVYALERLLAICPDEALAKTRLEIMEAVDRHLWDGDHYAAGINDEGVMYGVNADADAKRFLNTQTWAIIAGIARGERLEKTLATIESMKTPFGYVLIDPPFAAYSPVWGRVSVKQKGTTENGSVYCHSVMFKAFSDCMRGDGDAAVDAILRSLPTNPENPPAKNRQIPLYYPNYYFGFEDENFGHSSCHYRTGTVAWHIWVLLEYVFGFRAGVDGVEIKPCLPKSWTNVKLTRKFGGKTYVLAIKNGKAKLTEQ